MQLIQAFNPVNILRHQAWLFEGLPDVDLCEDPDANSLLAMAVVTEVDYLVSDNKRDVLSLK